MCTRHISSVPEMIYALCVECFVCLFVFSKWVDIWVICIMGFIVWWARTICLDYDDAA